MSNTTTAPTGVVSSTELGAISREEWIRRYADRVHAVTGCGPEFALETAKVGADCYEEDEWQPNKPVVWWGGPSGEHMSPEDAADEEMSYWDDDGE